VAKHEVDNALEELGQALDSESHEWLLTQHPLIADRVEKAVSKGHTPEEIKWAVLRRTGRIEIAIRCELAARWLVGE
jgi:hypothetical protein